MPAVFLICRGLSSCCSSMVASFEFFSLPMHRDLIPSILLSFGSVSPALVPSSFLLPSYLAAASQVVLSQWLTLVLFTARLPVVMLSISVGCWLILVTLTVFCLDHPFSIVSSSLSELLLCRISRLLSGFSWSFGFVRILGFPPHPSLFHPSRCRLVFSHGSSPSGITFLHRFRLPSTALALSLFHFPTFFGVTVSMCCPLLLFFVSFLLVYMTYCSFASCSLFRLCSWVLRCPGSPVSIYDSAFFLGFTSSSFTASAFLLDSPYVSFFRASIVLPCDFSSTIYFSLSFSLRTFRRLPSLATVSSVQMHYSFFLCVCVELVGLPCFSTLFLSCPWFPFLSLSFRFVTSLSFFGRSSDLVASPFHAATESPFGLSPFLFSLFALLVR